MNKMFFEDSRRNFLKLMLSATISTISFPPKFLGAVQPFLKDDGNELLGIYGLNLDRFPQLYEIWGSVRFEIEGTIVFFPKVILTRVPKEQYGVDFIAVSEQCPHEGYLIKDLDPDTHLFECSGHGTLFDVTGRYLWGPASKNLQRFKVSFDGEKTVYIEIPALITTIKRINQYEHLFYLKQNIPNPCTDNCSIEFGIEKPSSVAIVLTNLNGITIAKLFESNYFEGNKTLNIDVSVYPAGAYIYSLFVNNELKISKKIIVQH
ncbi:MAG: T9SS type A sorting domain-containing protein [Candidatus Kapaibacteriales bacterium]